MTEPLQIIEESDSELTIAWSDGTESLFSAPELRRRCPCAGCVDEWTGTKTLDDRNVAADITFTRITLVGRYALNFHFSDGHDTGIFSFAYLRDLPGQRAAVDG